MTGELKRLEQETDRQERLKVLAEEIRLEHQACIVSMRQGMEHALKVGELLLQARENVWHGDWEDWVTLNCLFTPRHAWNYMQLARNKELFNSEIISEITVSRALEMTRIHTEVAKEVKEKKAEKARWKLELEDRQVKVYLDALKVFVQAVRDVVPMAEEGVFSPEAIRFTVRRHEGLRQELERLHTVFRQKLLENEEPVKTRRQELERSPGAERLGRTAKVLENAIKEYFSLLSEGDVHITELHYVVALLAEVSAFSREGFEYAYRLEQERYEKSGSEPGESE